MKRTTKSSRPVFAVALAVLGIWLLGSCQSIAGIEDVTYNEGIGVSQSSVECQEYCDTVEAACPGDLAVYEDRTTCEATCAAFDADDPSEEADTFACRLAQAKVAQTIKNDFTEKQPHCVAAGPGGGSFCSSQSENPDCEGYCSLFMQACPSTQADWGFGKHDECVQKCAALEPAGRYTAESAPDTGDTLACRLFYTSRALVDPSDTNCLSAALYPHEDQKCKPIGDPDCDHYCSIVQLACTGDAEVYESDEQCRQVCAHTEPGLVSDGVGHDTVGCRTYHSYNALVRQEEPHCSHSGPAGNGVCSTTMDTSAANCTPYCRLARAGCEDLYNEHYADFDECLDDCSKVKGAVPDFEKNAYTVNKSQTGNTLQCRILHAARALEKPDDAAAYCDAVFGDAPCN